VSGDARSVPRIDAREKLRGQAQFVGDMHVPGMLHAKVLRSPLAHARIVSFDATQAEALAGVVAVLSGADLADVDPYYGHAIRDRPIVAIDRVRFAGEPVAIVAAEDEVTAAAALRLIEVEYAEVPAACTVDSAMAPGAPELHTGPVREGIAHGLGRLPEREGNVCYRYHTGFGNTEVAFAAADVVIEGEYTFPSVYQYAMETHTVIAQYTSDEITLWATAQHPFLVRGEIAALFGKSASKVRIVVPYLGGGFGSKSYTKLEPMAVAIARKAGRPVRLVNSVDEAMLTTRRHGMRCWMRTAASADGRLLARQVTLWLDTGAYADNGPRVTATAGDAAPGPYTWNAVHVDALCVYTNLAPSGSYRAFGATHMQWIGELQVDEVARRVGLDPFEVRQRNLLERGGSLRRGAKPLDADLKGDLARVAAAIDWTQPKEANVGRGLSVGVLAAGAQPVSTAIVRMEADGQLVVLVGTTEMGQGARTVMAQLAAEQLGTSVDHVQVRGTDTRFTPYDRSTGASRSTTLAGLAVQRAAQQLRQRVLDIAADVWGVPADLLGIGDGGVNYENETLTYPELMTHYFGMVGGELIAHGEVRPEAGRGTFAAGPVFWEVGVAAAEVRVDPDTGAVRVQRIFTVADVGKAINPLLVERQDQGATMQGLGNALFEEILFEDGRLMNGSLLQYRVPSALDVPDEMGSLLVENADGPGPDGAKGCGEGGLAAVVAAIATAVADAGVPVYTLPLTPERVWRSMQHPR
jgi:CO/xanthine dehydrogenase Mo-binding subunit